VSGVANKRDFTVLQKGRFRSSISNELILLVKCWKTGKRNQGRVLKYPFPLADPSLKMIISKEAVDLLQNSICLLIRVS
jgi:hypothetical protein